MSKSKQLIKKNAALSFNRFFLYSAIIISIITSATYYKSLNNELTRWDDDIYVTNNPDITTLSSDFSGTVKKAFSTYVNGNYHPLTMLSFSIEYALFKINSKVFHTTNLLLHLLNSIMVLTFVWLLCRQQVTAFVTAMLFALHPMHVESVAWVSERKDLLYTLFYISAICVYLVYLQSDKNKRVNYLTTFFLFVLSCLSKGMAVSLPLVLLIIDFYKERKLSKVVILEKVPFFILSVVLGIVAIKAQTTVGAIDGLKLYNFGERILFSCYALVMYIWKLFFPFTNSCFYNYPNKQNDYYPAIVYLSPFVVIALSVLIYKVKSFRKEILFSIGFFVITIALVLQLLPVGAAVISERYTYVPYIGMFFLFGTVCNHLVTVKTEIKNILFAGLTLIFVAFSFFSYKATLLWKDGLTVLNHAVTTEKYDVCALLYKNRAIAYFYNQQYDKAVNDYTLGIKQSGLYTNLICDRGVTYFQMKEYNNAIADFNIVIKYDTAKLNAYHYRGFSYFQIGKYKEAIADLTEAIKINPIFWDHYYYRGLSNYIIGNYEDALKDYNYLIATNSVSTDVYNNRGLILLKLKKHSEALTDLTKAIELNPQNANAYFNKGLAYYNLEDYKNAIEQYSITLKYNPQYTYAYANRAQAYAKLKQYKEAFADASTAIQMGAEINSEFMETLKRNLKAN